MRKWEKARERGREGSRKEEREGRKEGVGEEINLCLGCKSELGKTMAKTDKSMEGLGRLKKTCRKVLMDRQPSN